MEDQTSEEEDKKPTKGVTALDDPEFTAAEAAIDAELQAKQEALVAAMQDVEKARLDGIAAKNQAVSRAYYSCTFLLTTVC